MLPRAHLHVAAMRPPPPGTSRQCGALHHPTGQLPQPRENFFVLSTLPRSGGSAGRERAGTTGLELLTYALNETFLTDLCTPTVSSTDTVANADHGSLAEEIH